MLAELIAGGGSQSGLALRSCIRFYFKKAVKTVNQILVPKGTHRN
jgi:hypothetical protein